MSEADYHNSVTVDDDEEGWQIVTHNRKRDHEVASTHGGGSVAGKNKSKSTASNHGAAGTGKAKQGISGAHGKNNKPHNQQKSGAATPRAPLSRAPTAESTTGSIAAAASQAGSEHRPRFVIPAALIQAVAEAAQDAAARVGGQQVALVSPQISDAAAAPTTGAKALEVYDAQTPRDVVIAPELREILKKNIKKAKKTATSTTAAQSGNDVSDTASVKSDASARSGKSNKSGRRKFGYGKHGKHAAAAAAVEPIIEGSWRRSADEDRAAEQGAAPASRAGKKNKKSRKNANKNEGSADANLPTSPSDFAGAPVVKAPKSKSRVPVRASTATGILRTLSQNTIREENANEDDDGIMVTDDDDEEEVSIGDEYSDTGSDDLDDDGEDNGDDADETTSLASEDLVGTGVLMIPPKVLYAPPPRSDASSVMSYAQQLKRTLSNNPPPNSGATSKDNGLDAPSTTRGTVHVVTGEQPRISRSATSDAALSAGATKGASQVASQKPPSGASATFRANKVPGFSDDEDEGDTPAKPVAQPTAAVVTQPAQQKSPAKGQLPPRHNTLIDGTDPSGHATVTVATTAAVTPAGPVTDASSTAQASSATANSKPQKPQQQHQSKTTDNNAASTITSRKHAKAARHPSQPPAPTSLSESVAAALSIEPKQLQATVGVLTILILLRLLGLL